MQRVASAYINLSCVTALLMAAVGGCREERERATAGVHRHGADQPAFTDVTESAGIHYRHHKPVLDHQLDNIMSWVCSVGAAAAAGDFDNDGWIDLYVTDSRKGTKNHLYRNNADGTFTDVGERAGVANVNNESGTSMDCVWGDYDNDGWIDLYVVRWGNDLLFRNNGDGTFLDVTRACLRKRDGSPGSEWANGNAAIFFDYDLDGRLDIYVGNYFDEVDLWDLKHTRIMHDSFETARNGGPNYLYHQEPDGTFIEIAESLGLDDRGWTLGVGSADLNNDGRPDLYCADDFGPDQLFVNNGDGTFTNATESAIGRDTKKGMNVDFGDYNNDGWLDIYVANITTAEYLQEGNMLWHNNGPVGGGGPGAPGFTDISMETGTYDGGWGWGAKFVDYDNDGDLDIVAVNGFISAGQGNYWYDLASWTVLGQDSAEAKNWPTIGDRSFSGYESFRVWRNDGFDSFTQQAKNLGLDSKRDGRGLVSFDYDNDGDQDLFVANQDQAPHLFRNDLDNGNHWVTVSLEADPSTGVNADAIGARVTVVSDGGQQFRERDGGNGYCGQSDPRVHFGLGADTVVTLLEVRWPDGGLQYLENVPADGIITIRQDPSKYAAAPMLAVAKPPKPRAAQGEPKRVLARIDSDELNRLLIGIEDRLRRNPDSYARAFAYRRKCVDYDRHDRSIAFFEQLRERYPSNEHVAIELSATYIDKIPTCGGIAAIVSKGTLARKSLDVLDRLMDLRGGSWVAYYARGVNHLHWPRMLLHSDDAAVDLARCLKMQTDAGPPGAKDYYERIYVTLGDAYAKNKEYTKARRTWRDGLAVFPESAALAARTAITSNGELLDYVEQHRSLQKPIDTDFSFLEREP